MSWLYLNEAIEAAPAGSTVAIVGEEAKHAVTVARTRVGDRIAIGNGRGLIARGVVASVGGAELTMLVEASTTEPAATPELWLIQALAKGDRDELAVQAATELGVSGVIPWSAERSVTRWLDAKAEKGRARWEAIVREASKQAIRACVPKVQPLQSTKDVATAPGLLLVLDPEAEVALTSVTLPVDGRVSIAVGPEGGISHRELELLAKAGAVAVRLGTEVLRTSTAGPAAIAVLNARLGRW
jgi:16S rRNA (uracil1498-N3)-methyltransferase